MQYNRFTSKSENMPFFGLGVEFLLRFVRTAIPKEQTTSPFVLPADNETAADKLVAPDSEYKYLQSAGN
jgi:hypothetical protein